MIDLDAVYACPRCHLRFPQLAELRGHMDDEHPAPEPVDPTSARATSGRITVPLDPDQPPPVALAVAARLADQLGCSLDLVAAPGLGLQDGTRAFLRARARELRAAGARDATTELLATDRPATGVLGHVARAGSDLLCLSTRAHHGPAHLLFGSVAEAILLGAEVPVLLAGPHVTAPSGPYRSVVACVDGSAPSAIALLVAERLRERLDADLHLVEVVAPDVDVAADTYEGAELVRIARGLHPEPSDYELLHGRHPDAAIVEHADRLDGAIVVTGMHGRTGLRSLLVGSVARGVVAGSRHPTLVVPSTADPDAFLRPNPATARTHQGADR